MAIVDHESVIKLESNVSKNMEGYDATERTEDENILGRRRSG